MGNSVKAKALRNIVLPDGKSVHEGEEFIYNHDFVNAGEFEIVGEQNGQNAPEPDGQSDAALSVEEMKAIRLKAKDLKIAHWHTKSIDRLIKEIDEAEAKDGQNVPEAEATNGDDLTPVENDNDEVVVSKMETVGETVNEGNANA